MINLQKQLHDFPEVLQESVTAQAAAFCHTEQLSVWLQQQDDKFLASLCRVWASSEFVAGYCIKDPSLIINLVEKKHLFDSYDEGLIVGKLQEAISGVQDLEKLKTELRQFRNQEMIRIAWRDIAGWAGLVETTRDLSLLADACITQTQQRLQQWLMPLFGVPVNGQGETQPLIVLGMGKLGAFELNFCSDVDLIFAYPESGNTQGGARSLSNEEYFTRLGRQLIAVLDENTADGFVFRVDMRLRPFGNSGPLAASFDAIEGYYQSHGREWERYAMVKARAITGGESAQVLVDMLRPFVYRRYLDFGAYDALRDMKQRIEAEMAKKSMQDNVKLGPGGIREVEFIGQAFQLIRGGREKRLQERNILKILVTLEELNILPEFVVSELSDAYIFLRNTEHRLQEYAQQQTHLLPESETNRLRLAFSMGYASWDEFTAVLNTHRQRVHRHFEQVFAAPQTEHATTEERGLADLWLNLLDEQSAEHVLVQSGFVTAADALQLIRAFRQARSYSALASRGKQRMDQLIPLLLGAVGQCEQENRVLKRLLDLIEAIAKRTSYLALLVENPMALSQLVKLCAASPWISHQIAKQPLLLDELLDPRTLYKPPTRGELERELQHRLSHLDPDDLEQQMEVLRQFKNANVLRIAAADIMDAVPLMVVSDHLTDIAHVVLIQVLNIAWRYMINRHGRPADSGDDGNNCGFTVIAYGKFGGIELGYGSDLDLVFLYRGDQNGSTNGEKPLVNSVFYSRLGQRMIHILTALTPAGVLYEVDMRLRPSGASGLLVTHLDSFRDYQLSKAWTWEHQALARARPICGDHSVTEQFSVIRNQVLSRARNADDVQREVRTMRERMRNELSRDQSGQFDLKQGKGGIADIEFMVQYTVLAHASGCSDLLTYTDNIRILEAMMAAGLVSDENGRLLTDCYKAFRACVHRLTLQEQPAVTKNAGLIRRSAQVYRQWQQMMNA